MAVTTKPLAVCVGMGVALLASVSIGRQNQRVWKSLQRFSSSSSSASSSASRGRRGISSAPSSSSSAAAAAGRGDTAQRFLTCAQQLQHVGDDKLSRKTITVVQVRPAERRSYMLLRGRQLNGCGTRICLTVCADHDSL